MEESTVSVVFRIDQDLKKAFERVAKDKDQTVSQMLRAYIRYAVESHAEKTAQKDLFRPSETPKAPKAPKTPAKPEKAPMESKQGLLSMYKKGR
jgi:hypothetical protein